MRLDKFIRCLLDVLYIKREWAHSLLFMCILSVFFFSIFAWSFVCPIIPLALMASESMERLRFTFTPTAHVNLHHVTKFSPYFSFTVYCFYTKISSFMPVLSIRIVLDCFYLLIFYWVKFSTHACRLPYAANENFNFSTSPFGLRPHGLLTQSPFGREE